MSTERKIEKRMIPLTDEFMKEKKLYDKVWGYLQSISYLTKDNERIVYKTKDSTSTAIHKAIAVEVGKTPKGNPKYDISAKTVDNTLKLYKALGMIADGTAKDKDGKEVKVYKLSQSFERYKLIPLDTLRILLNATNNNTIKVYVYLLDKYEYKQLTKEKYTFTLKELCDAIGYTESRGRETVKDILFILQKIGLVEYTETYNTTLLPHPFPIHILDKVNKSFADWGEKPTELYIKSKRSWDLIYNDNPMTKIWVRIAIQIYDL